MPASLTSRHRLDGVIGRRMARVIEMRRRIASARPGAAPESRAQPVQQAGRAAQATR